MSENLARRVGRLVSGSLNALVDAVENATPEAVLEQALRELDGAIDAVRAELGQQLAQKHLASKRLMEENSRHVELGEQIGLAVDGGRDDLAEAGIAEQLDIEARIPVLEATIGDCAAREKELESYIQALLAKKREMRADLEAFLAQRKMAQPPAASAVAGNTATGGDRRAEQAVESFERVMSRVSGLPGRGLDSDKARQLAELDDLSRHNRVRERLAALKADK